MLTAQWNKLGLWEHGTTATAWIRNGVGTARLRIDDEAVFETHGGEFNTRTEWDSEREAIVDLAVILSLEAYARGAVELADYILGGFNSATVYEDTPSIEQKPSVMYEAGLLLAELEAGHLLCLESIAELESVPVLESGQQLDLFA